jgi:hypothetical protein
MDSTWDRSIKDLRDYTIMQYMNVRTSEFQFLHVIAVTIIGHFKSN